MLKFVSGWETGIALIIFNCLLFILTVVSFGLGFKKVTVKNKGEKSVIKVSKTAYSTLCFFAFLAVWVFLTLFMVYNGFM